MANTTRIKMMVARDNQAYFVKYYDNQLWYRLAYTDGYGGDPDTAHPFSGVVDTFEFPVPIADIGGATFLAQEKALLLMRYIRKHMEWLEAAREQEERSKCAHGTRPGVCSVCTPDPCG